MLTGPLPREHGIVGNGWYFRDLAEVLFWRRPTASWTARSCGRRRAGATRLHHRGLFWWYNMYAQRRVLGDPAADLSRRRAQDPRAVLRPAGACAASSRPSWARSRCSTSGARNRASPSSDWIARASRRCSSASGPGLMLVYLPHLDYTCRARPRRPAASATRCRAIDARRRRAHRGVRAAPAPTWSWCPSTASRRPASPIHLNRVLRDARPARGARDPRAGSMLDSGASRAFAVADHQVAHVYVQRPAPTSAGCAS